MSKETNIAVVPEESKELQIKSWNELQERAKFFSESSLVPDTLRKKPQDIAIIMQMGWEIGIPPMQAINSIHVIQGKPCVSPELCIALIRSRVLKAHIKFGEMTESRAVVTMARDRDFLEESYTAVWDDAKAAKMGLLGKDNYKKQKGNMLKWRAIGEAAHVVFPDILKGLYLGPEMADIDIKPATDSSKAKALESIVTTAKKVDVIARDISTPISPMDTVKTVLDSTLELTKEPISDVADNRTKLGEQINAIAKRLGWKKENIQVLANELFSKQTIELANEEMVILLDFMMKKISDQETLK